MDWEAAGNEKKPKKKGRGKLILIALVAVILIAAVGGKACSGPEKLDWPTTGLAAMLPDPPTKYGEVDVYSTSLSARFEQTDADDFNKYVEACKDKGFTVDAEEDGLSYEAFNEDGYELSVSFYDDHMSVSLDEPVEMAEISWPTVGVAAMLPAPASTYGVITSDSSDYLSVMMGKTDKQAYASYVEACISAGFNVDYSKGDDSFSAKDVKGNSLSIYYRGFNMMEITLDVADEPADADADKEAPVEDASAEETPAATSAEEPAQTTTANSADARAVIDEYEAFMNEYVDFMQKYKNSTDTGSMLVDYGKMMQRYAQMTDKFDALDGTLSDADAAYYIEVQGRVLQKLQAIQ